jgi:peptidyl-prolyl cis-trans isomerase SurA
MQTVTSTRLAICWLLCVAAVPTIQAQGPQWTPVDSIAAIVGDQVIPMSRLAEEINVMRARGEDVPTDAAALAEFRRTVLDQLIDRELLAQAARRDTSVQVTDQEVQAATDQSIEEVRGQFASALEFQRQLRQSGFATVDEYRRWLADQTRRDLHEQALIEGLDRRGELTPLPPTERELRLAFQEFRARQPTRPASVSFRQILVPVRPDSAELRRARTRADSLRARLTAGEDFAALAREHSDDPTTAQQGGELGWVRRGQLVREVEDVAFRIRPGVVSQPVLSEFGFHLIEVRRTTPAAVLVRHILVRPEITEADKLEARTVAESIVRALREGASFDSLARLYRDPTEETLLENIPRDQLPPGYASALADAEPGDVVGPIELSDGQGRVKYAVAVFDAAREEGEYRFEDVRDQLRARVMQTNALERFLEKLRERTYIEIRI